jgi:hypothetical protein
LDFFGKEFAMVEKYLCSTHSLTIKRSSSLTFRGFCYLAIK